MNDINEIKLKLETMKGFGSITKGDILDLITTIEQKDQFNVELCKQILAHETTIESQNTIINQQQEAIKYWQNDSKLSQDCSARKEVFIKSQKEEIESLNNFHKGYAHQSKVIETGLNSQIESLKAITELAVKELKVQLNAAKVWGMDGTVKSISTTLSEIERLQNATT